MSQNQAYLFYIFLLTGLLIGILFDLFRVFRKAFKHSDTFTIIQDIIFFIIASILVVFSLFKFNNGEVRSYVFIGIFSGLLIYYLIFSKIFIKINVKIIECIKKIIGIIFKILIFPFCILIAYIKKTIFKPICFVFINIKKSISAIYKKNTKSILKYIKINKKSTN